MAPVADQQPADVVGLEEPLVRVDGHRVRAIEVRDATGVARRQPGAAAVRRVDVEPQAVRRGDVRQLADGVDRAGVRRAGDRRDRERRQAGGQVARDGLGDGRAAQPERVVGRHDHEGVAREPEEVERPRDREVRLVAGVDAAPVELAAARRPPDPEDLAEAQVAGDRHPHEVGHHAARREQAERAAVEADEVAQPADDLLLDERGERAGVPDVDALVGHLGEQLAHHRHRQRRRREVAELARVLRRHLPAGQPLRELREDVARRASGRPGRVPGPVPPP